MSPASNSLTELLKDQTLALTIEAGAPQQLLLWKSELEQEIADVLIEALDFCNAAGIDAARAIDRKFQLNAERYLIDCAIAGALESASSARMVGP